MAKQAISENKFEFKIGDIVHLSKEYGLPNLRYEIVERKSEMDAGYKGGIGNVYGKIPFESDFWSKFSYSKEYQLVKCTKKEIEETRARVAREKGNDGLADIQERNKKQVNAILTNTPITKNMAKQTTKAKDDFKFKIGDVVVTQHSDTGQFFKHEIVDRKSGVENTYGFIPYATDFWAKINYRKESELKMATKQQKEQTLQYAIKQEGIEGYKLIQENNKKQVKAILTNTPIPNTMAKQTTKKPENFKFRVGQLVKYIGENKEWKNDVFEIEKRDIEKPMLKANYNSYCLSKAGSKKIVICVAENMLKKYEQATPEEKKFISDVDKRAREIQLKSGVKKVERVTFYNLTREEAKRKAFAEANK